MNQPVMQGRPLRIFVVENHEDTLMALTQYLAGGGHTVRSALSMEEALERLPSAEIDVLISDIGLPDGDGWELLRRAQLDARTYTVAMSGFGHNADRGRSEAAGFRKHLIKPFSPEDLDDILALAATELAQRGNPA